ncbi:Cytosolic Fe-S cluster assembly factor nar1 [Rhizina undulata]
MSAILSADDLNDFISPGVACIKPVETLPVAPPKHENPYEVTHEDKPDPTSLPPAQISLTDCLACSGCVTSAEAVLVSLQSHNEVLSNLSSPSAVGKKFIALLSPQSRASLAAAFRVSEIEVSYMVQQLLCGSAGIKNNGKEKGFDFVVDTNVARDIALRYAGEEVLASLKEEGTVAKKKPILTSSCPGFICYLESTQPVLIPHLSTLKSPQAILGTVVKSMLAEGRPEEVYVVGIMPCFDKKLEGARGELTSSAWLERDKDGKGVRDVDCVITTRELISLAEARRVDFRTMLREPLAVEERNEVADTMLERFLTGALLQSGSARNVDEGTSDGYLYYIAQRLMEENPGSQLRIEKGRNLDTVDYVIFRPRSLTEDAPQEEVIARLARCYGFRNIQNLVRRLKPTKQRVLPRFGKSSVPETAGRGLVAPRRPKSVEKAGTSSEYVYVEVMACPGGCTNGGGQIKYDDEIIASSEALQKPVSQKEWLARVDEAYFSSEEEEKGREAAQKDWVIEFVEHWERIIGINRERLLFTSYRKVENDLGGRLNEKEVSATVRAAELAGKAGGGW